MVSGEATDAPCPRCDSQLGPIATQDAVDAYHECKKCHGVFLGHHTLATATQKFVAGELLPPILVEYVDPAPDQVVYLRCPCCGRLMHRRRMARMVVDVCKLHGTWFDRGEVARVLAYEVEPPSQQEEEPLAPQAHAAVARALSKARVEAGVDTHKTLEEVSFLRSLLAVLFGV
jgi:Zn-finger nucleic acid-binding protein